MKSRGSITTTRLIAALLTALAGVLWAGVLWAGVLWAGAPAVAATASEWQRSPESGVRLLSAVTGTGELDALPLGLEFDLAPGWKTYWRSPGEGGFPPKLDWEGSDNVASAQMVWPAPERFSILGIDSIGYADAVVLPITVRLAEPGEAARLRLAVDYLTCEEICIPQRAELDLLVPPGPAEPSGFAHLIDRYRGRVPAPAGPGMAVESAAWVHVDGRLALRAVATGSGFRQPDLFVEGPLAAVWGRPTHVLSEAGRRATVTVPRLDAGAGPDVGGEKVTLTLVDGGRAVEQTLSVASGGTAAEALPGGAGDLTLLAVLAVALLGGLILNLMPCVLPVLSIKVLSLLKHGGGELSAARRSFVATAAGIVACFLLLAGLAATLRAAGLAVGWGMQFQQPVFLVAMTMVLVLFACNLWGFYEVRLPGWLNVGGGPGGTGLSGSFLTGMLATLLATPCSAPFVGTAVAYALSRGSAEIFTIFAALGTGLALPYLVIALYPRMATVLPRPGAWMLWLRRVLGFALLGTAVWLLFVLQAQTGSRLAGIVAAFSLAAIAVLWGSGRVGPRIAAAVTACLVAVAVAMPVVLEFRPGAPHSVADDRWLPFDRPEIDRLVGEGRLVFVDVTADWCITCQVNKAAVLEREPVAGRLFGRGDVRPMQADWTRPSDEIAGYLASFGRYGIPFNAVYGPGAPAGIVLPELLSADAVMAAIEAAAGAGDRQISAR